MTIEMIENPSNISEQIENLTIETANTLNDHLARIKDLELDIENHVTASNRHILEIFYTMRTDEGPINGAYDCDGTEYSADDFGGEHNPYALLVDGKAPTCSYDEYATAVTTFGSCGHFALDLENRKFKVPTIHKRFLEPTKVATEVGNIISAGLPNITGSFKGIPNHDTFASDGKVFVDSGTISTAVCGYQNNAGNYNALPKTIVFTASGASSIYGNSDTVQPRAILIRAMVQLANAIDEESYQKCLLKTGGSITGGIKITTGYTGNKDTSVAFTFPYAWDDFTSYTDNEITDCCDKSVITYDVNGDKVSELTFRGSNGGTKSNPKYRKTILSVRSPWSYTDDKTWKEKEEWAEMGVHCDESGFKLIQSANMIQPIKTIVAGTNVSIAGNFFLCQKLGRIVILHLNFQAQADLANGSILMTGLPPAYINDYFLTEDTTVRKGVSGSITMTGTTGTGRVYVNSSGQLISDGAITTGWYGGCMCYFTSTE